MGVREIKPLPPPKEWEIECDECGYEVTLWEPTRPSLPSGWTQETRFDGGGHYGLPTSTWVLCPKCSEKWECPINMEGCRTNCGNYGCGN